MLKLLALLFGALKFGKVLTTGGSMLLSIVVYAFVFGWGYAVGFVALIFVHEMGHFIAARQRGLDVGAPTFIPFVGAWIELKDMPHNAETEAYVGLGGPLVGTLGAFACYYLARQFDSTLLLAVSYSGFFINLFNMIPLSPLDGGRITAVLGPRVWLIGVPILIGVFLWHPSPMLILIALFAAPQVMKAIRYDKDAPENRAYYDVTAEQRLTYGAYYMILLVVLAAMTFSVHEMLGAAGSGRVARV
jgi:Zn-dependent protease